MTAHERLASARLKIERAQKHISDVEAEVLTFVQTNPYRIKAKKYVHAGQVLKGEYVLYRVDPVPSVISVMTGDALHNLRSALDHLAYQLFLIGTPAGRSWRHVYFPIYESVEEYRAKKGRRVKGMRKDAIESIDALKPYRGGNEVLWHLHELNNTDKHRLVLTVGAVFQKIDFAPVLREEAARFMAANPPTVSLIAAKITSTIRAIAPNRITGLRNAWPTGRSGDHGEASSIVAPRGGKPKGLRLTGQLS